MAEIVMTQDDATNPPDDDSAPREVAIREIISLLEDALRRCDVGALHVAAIHIDRAIHECSRRIEP